MGIHIYTENGTIHDNEHPSFGVSLFWIFLGCLELVGTGVFFTVPRRIHVGATQIYLRHQRHVF